MAQLGWVPVFIALHIFFYVSMLQKKILREDFENKRGTVEIWG